VKDRYGVQKSCFDSSKNMSYEADTCNEIKGMTGCWFGKAYEMPGVMKKPTSNGTFSLLWKKHKDLAQPGAVRLQHPAPRITPSLLHAINDTVDSR
jgi:hypothetical protein